VNKARRRAADGRAAASAARGGEGCALVSIPIARTPDSGRAALVEQQIKRAGVGEERHELVDEQLFGRNAERQPEIVGSKNMMAD
jgi:hypothetical protein